MRPFSQRQYVVPRKGVPVRLCIQPVGDGWAAWGLAAEVVLLEAGDPNGVTFFIETPEEPEQKAREQLGTPAKRN